MEYIFKLTCQFFLVALAITAVYAFIVIAIAIAIAIGSFILTVIIPFACAFVILYAVYYIGGLVIR